MPWPPLRIYTESPSLAGGPSRKFGACTFGTFERRWNQVAGAGDSRRARERGSVLLTE